MAEDFETRALRIIHQEKTDPVIHREIASREQLKIPTVIRKCERGGSDDLKKAGESVVQLIAAMMNLAHRNGFRELHDVELNEALFNLHPLFPFTE